MAAERPRATIVARVDTLLACVRERVLRELLGARPEWWRVIATGVREYGYTAISAYTDSLIPDNDRSGLVEQGYRTLRVVDVPRLPAVESGK